MSNKSWQTEDWVNDETETVAHWLLSSDHIDILVKRWHEENLLGVDLADALKQLATESTNGSFETIIERTDWNQIAEQFALHFVGVDEERLAKRRKEQLR